MTTFSWYLAFSWSTMVLTGTGGRRSARWAFRRARLLLGAPPPLHLGTVGRPE